MRTNGIDISKWQGDIDWAQLPAGVAFVFIKATEVVADPKFQQNWANAAVDGRIRGAYHLIRLDRAILPQVDLYLRTVPFEPGDLPPVLDVETARIEEVGAEKAYDGILQWLRAVELHTGRAPILYISPRGVKKLEGRTDFLRDYPLWVANYVKEPPPEDGDEPTLPKRWTDWSFWQYTSDGPGEEWGMESSGLDLNYFNGSLEELRAFAYGVLSAATRKYR